MEAGVAEGLGLKIGDTITLNVLGREVTATIYNLRKVNWRSFAINFVFVFSPHTFKGAPYTVLVTAALPSGGRGGESALMNARGARLSLRRGGAGARRAGDDRGADGKTGAGDPLGLGRSRWRPRFWCWPARSPPIGAPASSTP